MEHHYKEFMIFFLGSLFGLALVGKDIVLRFIIEYGSFGDFGP
jgi:hypothetical protein